MVEMNERVKPYASIIRAINIFRERGLKAIVEIGGMRQALNHEVDDTEHDCCQDGHSTYLWARTGAWVRSVDIDLDCSRLAAATCRDWPRTAIYTMDGLLFLDENKAVIDLLYLDAWDVGEPLYQEKHLEAYNVAKRNMNERGLILIDDTDVEMIDKEYFPVGTGNGGKGKLVIEQAHKDGWKILWTGRQTCLSLV